MEKTMWKGKKQKALERFITAWKKYDGKTNPEAVNIALDTLTIAHIAAKFDLDRVPPTDWEDMAEKAIERLVAAWEKSVGPNAAPEAEETLDLALDEVAVAHAAAAFEGLSGPIKW
jgi:hypothetical protein